jgi:hypothetical protein
MKNQICEAIKDKRLLQFQYDNFVRVVEPHILGRNASGNDVLSAYLVRGYTESDRKPYWRRYLLSEIRNLTVLDEEFPGPRKGYNPRDKTMEYIYCRLGY